MDLKEIFKTLGIPFGLVAVIVALLAWAGLTVEQLGTVAVSLVGLQLFLSLLIDVLKYTGVVNDGTAGKWSAAFNLLTLIGVFVYLKFFPTVDIHAIDTQVAEITKILGMIFVYVTQVVGTKAMHKVTASYVAIPAG